MPTSTTDDDNTSSTSNTDNDNTSPTSNADHDITSSTATVAMHLDALFLGTTHSFS